MELNAFAAAGISLSWRLIGNQSKGGYRAELTIRNDNSLPLNSDWTICFNSASKLLSESVGPAYELAHINGDFYSLRPAERYRPIPSGDSSTVKWSGTPWAINISDAPSGFYLVRGERSDQAALPIALPLKVGSFPEADKLRRGETDVVPCVTAESRYKENEPLTLLPPETLVKVVPTPITVKRHPGNVKIHQASVVYYDPQLENEARQLVAALEPILRTKLSSQAVTDPEQTSPNAITLRIGSVPIDGENKRTGDAAYLLSAAVDRGVEIIGSDPSGVFYGTQTLRALVPVAAYREPVPEFEIEAVTIADAPRFPYRGVHLDVARNFQRPETVKKLIDLMAFYKLNRLHWHLTDDEGWRIEIKQLPELTAVGGHRGHTLNEAKNLIPSYGSGPDPKDSSSPGNGFYTQAEIVEILQYAKNRHVQVIPEIDLPGHARAAIKAMEARRRSPERPSSNRNVADFLLRDPDDESIYESVQMWRDNLVDVGRDDIYRFVDIVIGELTSIYDRAGVPLATVHLGGDEVPDGVWEKSPACEAIPIDATSKVPRRGQLEQYFLNRASDLLKKRSIQPACWEDCLLLATDTNSAAGDDLRAAGKPAPTAYVWNNVWGWGREDAAYRLANAGFDVVLCNATHLYFDLACEKDPLEPGYYWAGFVDIRKPFEFVPLDVFQNADRNSMGQPVSAESLAGRTELSNKGKRHVLGIQGQLWGENLRDPQSLEYMAFPRLITLAERAWAQSPAWANTSDPTARRQQLDRDWNQFANRLGQRELPRLDWLNGGVNYRLPPPGAVVRDGVAQANVAFPGLTVRYSDDGSEPNKNSSLYEHPIRMGREIKLKTFDELGRGSRTVHLHGNHGP